MSIINKKLKHSFTQISNEIINSQDIEYKALGIYLYLMSKPDKWNFSQERLAKAKNKGLDYIRSGLRDLEYLGLLVRKPSKNEKTGQFDGFDYEIYDSIDKNRNKTKKDPTLKDPTLKDPTLKDPTLENPTLENHYSISKKEYSKKEYSKKDKESEKINFPIQELNDKHSNYKNTPIWPQVQDQKFPDLTETEIDLEIDQYLAGKIGQASLNAIICHLEEANLKKLKRNKTKEWYKPAEITHSEKPKQTQIIKKSNFSSLEEYESEIEYYKNYHPEIEIILK